MKNSGKAGAFTLSCALLGTFIGAGFASGREISEFFVTYGKAGVILSLFSSVFLFILCGAVMAKSLKGESEIGAAKTLSALMSFFVLSAMLAGFGSMTSMLWGMNPLVGSAIFALILFFLGALAENGFMASFNLMVPFMIALMLFLCLPPAPHFSDPTQSGSSVFSALLYLSYNFAMMYTAVSALGKNAQSRSSITKSTLICCLICALTLVSACFAISSQGLTYEEMPLFTLSQSMPAPIPQLFSACLTAGIFSTAAGIMVGLLDFLPRFSPKIFKNPVISCLLILVPSLVLSAVGFSEIVSKLYRFNGLLGLILIAAVLFKRKRL